jgi:hypothetical protein
MLTIEAFVLREATIGIKIGKKSRKIDKIQQQLHNEAIITIQ